LPVQAITRQSLTEQVAKQIADLILSGELRPGDRLPSEKQLIEATGVSRPSVREALRGLAALGLIEARQGSGRFVRRTTPDGAVGWRLGAALPERAQMAAIQEARRVIEPVVVALAAQRATEDDLRCMEAALAAYEAALARGEDVFPLGVQVHRAFSEGCGNAALVEVVRTLSELAQVAQRRIYRRAGLSQAESDVPDHRSIYEAVARRRPEAALDAMLRHLGHVDETLHQAMLAATHTALAGPAHTAPAAAHGSPTDSWG
jgi:GntR family transcriptional repressor for pyruvate dehydrogenase complex